MITFAIAGVIVWQPAVLMILGTVIGGYGGAYYARRLNQDLVKRFVILVGFIMTCYFFIVDKNLRVISSLKYAMRSHNHS